MDSTKEFKIGDKVKVIDRTNPIYMDVEIGEIGEVIGFDDRWDCPRAIKVNFNRCHQTCEQSQVEHVSKTLHTLQEGDLVRLYGDERTVIAVCGRAYLLSVYGNQEHAGAWYTAKELEDEECEVKGAEDEETPMTVEEVSKLVGKRVKIVEGGK